MGDAADQAFKVKIWGARGAAPTPCHENERFGGNTTCVEVRGAEDEVLVLDGGTGIHALGREILKRAAPPRTIHIFFTHFHWDHIQGMPFFEPLYSPEYSVVLYSAHPPDVLQAVLTGQMLPPYFPVPWEELSARIEYRQVGGAQVTRGGVGISCFPLHHPQGSAGYRIEQAGRKVIFATDHEHGDAAIDRGLREQARDADLVIYDAQYTPAEYKAGKAGWGHSTWQVATRVAREAGVRQLCLCHHDPDRDDEALDGILELARAESGDTVAAAEGMEL